MVCEFKPRVGLHAEGVGPARDSQSLSAPSPHSLKINLKKSLWLANSHEEMNILGLGPDAEHTSCWWLLVDLKMLPSRPHRSCVAPLNTWSASTMTSMANTPPPSQNADAQAASSASPGLMCRVWAGQLLLTLSLLCFTSHISWKPTFPLNFEFHSVYLCSRSLPV